MNLWLIVYAAGQIGGVAGPLPYDMDECVVRRDALRASQQEALIRKTHQETGAPLTEEQLAGVASMSFECEYRDVKPELGDPQ